MNRSISYHCPSHTLSDSEQIHPIHFPERPKLYPDDLEQSYDVREHSDTIALNSDRTSTY